MANSRDPDHRAQDVNQPQAKRMSISRRMWMAYAGLGAAAAAGSAKIAWDLAERFQRSSTAIVAAPAYDASLEDIVRRGLQELAIGRKQVRQKTILLKPNLVEPSNTSPHINTHPALIRAVAEVFRRWDAAEVIVAEGAGHVRDTWLVLEQSGFDTMLNEAKLRFVDLNHDDVVEQKNRARWTSLKTLCLPRTLRQVDWIVSVPKMKTHHWTGVTLSMKNLFGVMPGVYYGWPKNVLHWQGIVPSILDINSAVKCQLAIVDGIIAMDGDGPIMGDPRPLGVLVLGTNLPAVDATSARVMGLDPLKVDYLRGASGSLGPIRESHIQQRGETIASSRQPFRLLEHFAHLKSEA